MVVAERQPPPGVKVRRSNRATHPSRTKDGQYLCACGTTCGRRSDFKRHVENHCERGESFNSCSQCYFGATNSELMRLHQTFANHSGVAPCEPIEKRAYGCPFCGGYCPSRDAYARCMIEHQRPPEARELKSSVKPEPSKALIGLLKQSPRVERAVTQACTNAGYDANAWQAFTWSYENYLRLSRLLEYGCSFNSTLGAGVHCPDTFFADLVSCAYKPANSTAFEAVTHRSQRLSDPPANIDGATAMKPPSGTQETPYPLQFSHQSIQSFVHPSLDDPLDAKTYNYGQFNPHTTEQNFAANQLLGYGDFELESPLFRQPWLDARRPQISAFTNEKTSAISLAGQADPAPYAWWPDLSLEEPTTSMAESNSSQSRTTLFSY
jgi:hypothetical protein